jgi:hypothetical protein
LIFLTRAELLLERLKKTRDDDAALDLLAEFQSGFPVERLRELLVEPAGDAARAGIWIASELGGAVRPLLDEIARSLLHPDRYVRFFALDCVLAGAGEGDGPLLGVAATLLADPDKAVRWKAMNFLASASDEQLSEAADHVANEGLRDALIWLAAIHILGSAAARVKLVSPEDEERVIGAIGAARLATGDPSALQTAAYSELEEIRDFATERLERLFDGGRGQGGGTFS